MSMYFSFAKTTISQNQQSMCIAAYVCLTCLMPLAHQGLQLDPLNFGYSIEQHQFP